MTYNHSVPLDLVHGGFLLDDITLAFETCMLLSEATLEDSIRR